MASEFRSHWDNILSEKKLAVKFHGYSYFHNPTELTPTLIGRPVIIKDQNGLTVFDYVIIRYGHRFWFVREIYRNLVRQLHVTEGNLRAFDELIDYHKTAKHWAVLVGLYLSDFRASNPRVQEILKEELVDFLKMSGPGVLKELIPLYIQHVQDGGELMKDLLNSLGGDYIVDFLKFGRPRWMSLSEWIELAKQLDLDQQLEILRYQPVPDATKSDLVREIFYDLSRHEEWDLLSRHAGLLERCVLRTYHLSRILYFLRKRPEMIEAIKSRPLPDYGEEDPSTRSLSKEWTTPIFRDMFEEYYGWPVEERTLHPALQSIFQGSRHSWRPERVIPWTYVDLDRIPSDLIPIRKTLQRVHRFCQTRDADDRPSSDHLDYLRDLFKLKVTGDDELCQHLFTKGEDLLKRHPDLEPDKVKLDKVYPSNYVIEDDFNRSLLLTDFKATDGPPSAEFDLSKVDNPKKKLVTPVFDPRDDSSGNLEALCSSHGAGSVRYLRTLLTYLGGDFSETDNVQRLCQRVRSLAKEWEKTWDEDELKERLGIDPDLEDSLEDPLSGEEFDSPFKVVRDPDPDRGPKGYYFLVDSLIDFWIEGNCVARQEGEYVITDKCTHPVTTDTLSKRQVREVLDVARRYRSKADYFESAEPNDFILARLLTSSLGDQPTVQEILALADRIGRRLAVELPSQRQKERMLELLSQDSKDVLPELERLVDEIKTSILTVYALTAIENWKATLTVEGMMRHFGLDSVKDLTNPWDGSIPTNPHQVVKVGNRYIHFQSLLDRFGTTVTDWSKARLPLFSSKNAAKVLLEQANLMRSYKYLFEGL
jgi:hypothetical protein